MRSPRSVAVLAVFATGVLSVACGGTGTQRPGRGAVTTEAAVRSALARTGYTLSYRRAAPAPGYHTVVGRARSTHGVVDLFVVVADKGRYPGNASDPGRGTPVPPVLRYLMDPGSTYGNIWYAFQPQSPYRVARERYFGLGLVPRAGEREMVTRLDIAMTRLFAPGVRGGP